MATYFTLISFSAICSTAALGLELMHRTEAVGDKHNEMGTSLELCARSVMCVQVCILLALHLLILTIYHKYGF